MTHVGLLASLLRDCPFISAGCRMPCYQQTSGSMQWSNPAAEGATSIQGRHGSGGDSIPAQWRRVCFELHFNPDFVWVIKASLSHYRQELLCFICPGWCADSDVWMWCCLCYQGCGKIKKEDGRIMPETGIQKDVTPPGDGFLCYSLSLGLISAPESPWTWGWILKDTPAPDSSSCCWHRKAPHRVLGPFFCLGLIYCF